MQQELKSFLGTGWGFPPAFDKFSNSVKLSSDLADIEESIRIILDTYPGERIMQPEFGCFIKRFVFEIIDQSLIMKINEEIERALLNFEPRVKFIDTEVIKQDDHNGVLIIRINFSVIITNTRYNIVYPFYFNEGTNVPI